MRRHLLLLAATVVAVAAGVGATLLVQRIQQMPRPNPSGMAIVCDDDMARCWQRGDEVQPVDEYDACAPTSDAVAYQWLRLSEQGEGFFVFSCAAVPLLE